MTYDARKLKYKQIFYLLPQKPVHVRIIYAVVKLVGRCFLWSKTRSFLFTFLCCSVSVHNVKLHIIRAEWYKKDKRTLPNNYTVLSNIS